jgi:prevent-host-death family protein
MPTDLLNLQRVPVSKFRRELRKWLRIVERTGEPIVITQRNGPELVLMKYVDI